MLFISLPANIKKSLRKNVEIPKFQVKIEKKLVIFHVNNDF